MRRELIHRLLFLSLSLSKGQLSHGLSWPILYIYWHTSPRMYVPQSRIFSLLLPLQITFSPFVWLLKCSLSNQVRAWCNFYLPKLHKLVLLHKYYLIVTLATCFNNHRVFFFFLDWFLLAVNSWTYITVSGGGPKL